MGSHRLCSAATLSPAKKRCKFCRSSQALQEDTGGAVRLIGTSKPWTNSAGDFLHVSGKDINSISGSCLVSLSGHSV